ncbi:MAG: VOC family protein [Pseudolabrys sp.]|nr:VOC family protein [Pseudolabrys sp.]MBV9954881.1 VOC family protein [Pseudolabrys sp.]
MARGLDHIVHAVSDLDAAAQLYRRLGFKVGARNQHPWGTHNHIVQLPGFFIELLTFAEPDKLGTDGFSKLFAAFNRDYIARQNGLSMLILESRDAREDECEFEAAGIAESKVMRFEREGKRPDGSPVKVAFSLVFANDRAAPNVHFCTCRQHFPENFWNPAFQNHENGVQEVRGVILVAAKPEDHRDFLRAYTGSEDFYTEPGEVSAWTPRGALSVMTPDRFAAAFGGPTPKSGSALQAIRFAVADVTQTRALMHKGGLKVRDQRDGFVVDAADAMGALLSFEPLEKSRHSRPS